MVIFAVEIIYCMDTDDYKIEYHRLCRSVLSAVSAFKRATGVSRCCIETTDFEYDEELNEDGRGRWCIRQARQQAWDQRVYR